jgi:hypothetical protein
MNQENKIEKIETLPVPVDNDSNIIYSRNNRLRELIILKEETINGFKFRRVFHNGSAYYVIQDFYAQLGHKDASSSARMFHLRNKHIFEPEAFRKVEFRTPKGGRNYLTATLEVITFICARARTKKGDDFLKATGKLIRKFSEEKISLSPSHETVNLMLQDLSFHNSLIVKDLDQIKSVARVIPELKKGLEDLAVLFQINCKTGTSAVPESETIGKREQTIKFLIKDIALKEGIHFNTICNEFKQAFSLRLYSDLSTTDYRKAVIWLNKRHDQAKEKTTRFPTDSKLDTWLEKKADDKHKINTSININFEEVGPN